MLARSCSRTRTSSQEFADENEVDFSYRRARPGPLPRQRLPPARRRSRSSAARSRTRSRRSSSSACRRSSRELADEERGIILLTGTTGSGKSTTLAAMIDQINRTTPKHIVTIEDPIEFLHQDKRSVDQPARGRPGHRLVQARAAPRAAPGPGRDPGRRDARRGDRRDRAVRRRDRPPRALDAPHASTRPRRSTASSTSSRRTCPDQVRAMLAGTLKAVVSQRLVPTSDGAGRVAVLRGPAHDRRACKDMIMNPEETGAPDRGRSTRARYYGMQTFDQALLGHVQRRPRLDGGGAARRHAPARLQAAGRRRRPALDLGRAADGAGQRLIASMGRWLIASCHLRSELQCCRAAARPVPAAVLRPLTAATDLVVTGRDVIVTGPSSSGRRRLSGSIRDERRSACDEFRVGAAGFSDLACRRASSSTCAADPVERRGADRARRISLTASAGMRR